MRLLLLTLMVVWGPLITARSPPIIVPEIPSPYIVYMPDYYVPGEDFFVYILIANATASQITYIINIGGTTAVEETLPYVPVQLFTISHKSFSVNYHYGVEVRVSDGKEVLFSKYIDIYTSHWRKSPTPEKSLFIQRDKPLYKPNDKVRFRCFGLDNQLRVIKEPIDIKLYDPKNNLMQIWHKENSTTGVISGDVQLSDQPVLGKWSLKIKQANSKLENTASFNVREFVLPPIKVTLEGDKYVYHLARPAIYLAWLHINLFVNARYSFGGAVKGKLLLRVSIISRNEISIEIKRRISGRLRIRYSLKQFLMVNKISLVPAYSHIPKIYSFKIVAIVQEMETGLKIESSPMYVKIRAAPVKIDAPYSIVFKPNFTTNFKVYIKREDGNPLTIDDRRNNLNVTFIGDKKEDFSILIYIPEDGCVRIAVPHEIYKQIKISYRGNYQGNRYIRTKQIRLQKFESPINAYVSATLNKTNIYAGDEINVRIRSTIQLENIYYLVLKGNTPVAHGNISVVGDFADYGFYSKEYWFPGVNIVFTCITTSDQILVDILPVELDAKFRYQVGGKFSPLKNSAKSTTELNMTSEPESVLFLMSVDERLHYLAGNEYITKESIFGAIAGKFKKRTSYGVTSISYLLQIYNIAFRSNRIRDHFIMMIEHMMAPPMDNLMVRPIGPSKTTEDTVKVRDNFQDVWIWEERKVPCNGILNLKKTTPDSITSWKTNAFAVHPKKGISVLEKPLEFVSFQKMFLKLDLPYSVIRKEKFKIIVIVFNYLRSTKMVTVSATSTGLRFLRGRKRTLKVVAGSYRSIRFLVRAMKAGDAHITMNLRSGRKDFDRIKKTLIVKPEGRTSYFSEELQIDLSNKTQVITPYRIIIPKIGIVRASTRIEVSVIGDIMGPAIENLGNYVRLPRGCGEQTALSFVPNVVIFNYLKIRKALNPGLKEKIIKYTESGYKNQLRFQRTDGSFSAFRNDMQGSEWLTAFIAGAFQMVIDSGMGVYIDKEKLKRSVLWLTSKQQRNGAFNETGRVIHRRMQGGAGDGYALTAYMVISLYSLRSYDEIEVNNTIENALEFMNNLNFEKLDVYTLCIFLYAYAKLGFERQFDEIEKILQRIATKDESMVYWKGEYEIEQTSYALLGITTCKNSDKTYGLRILRWLLSKRTSLGGYSNTQDTIVALKAMSAYALLFEETTGSEVQIKSGQYTKKFATITSENMYLVQKATMPNWLRNFQVIASGGNYVYVRFSWQYNVDKEKDDNFGLSVTAHTELINKDLFKVCICYTWKKAEDPGMVVSEVVFPSGFALRSLDCKIKSCAGEIIKNPGNTCWNDYDTRIDGVDIYMNDLKSGKTVCSEILSNRQHAVENRDINMYITTEIYYDSKSIITAFSPFSQCKSGGTNCGSKSSRG